ncbi:Hypothetical predicted protein, partial [Xyrichtys novacula]
MPENDETGESEWERNRQRDLKAAEVQTNMESSTSVLYHGICSLFFSPLLRIINACQAGGLIPPPDCCTQDCEGRSSPRLHS